MHLATQNAHLLNIFQTVANESKGLADQQLLEKLGQIYLSTVEAT
jgi:hypothetical protein